MHENLFKQYKTDYSCIIEIYSKSCGGIFSKLFFVEISGSAKKSFHRQCIGIILIPQRQQLFMGLSCAQALISV